MSHNDGIIAGEQITPVRLAHRLHRRLKARFQL